MRVSRAVASVCFGLSFFIGGSASAQQKNYLFGIIDEVRVGVLAHDALRNSDESGSVDINFEIDFGPLWRFETGNRALNAIVNPRPMIGGDIHTKGQTHQAYFGLDWMYQFDSGIFLEASFGGTVHSGRLQQDIDPNTGFFVHERQPSLGTRVLFRESIDIGYRIAQHHGVSVHYSHMSNAGISSDNDGMDFLGVRYGYRF